MHYTVQSIENVHTDVGHCIDQHINLSMWLPVWPATWIMLISSSAAISGAETLDMVLLTILLTDQKSFWTILSYNIAIVYPTIIITHQTQF